MSILLTSKTKDFNPIKAEILALDETLEVDIWPVVRDKSSIQMAVSWNHTHGLLKTFPNLKCIMSYGAGADHIISEENLPDVKICRMVLPSLSNQMADYVLMHCLAIQRKFFTYANMMSQGEWKQIDTLPKKSYSIGILGAGQTGSSIARVLTKNDFKVLTWSINEHHIEGVKHYAGETVFSEFLNETNILVCALPLTGKTEGILNLDNFKQLQKPAYLINVGRGDHLIEEDLIYALDTGVIEAAVLDAFQTEPLPENHTFWNRPEITITPHIAALTDSKEAASLIVENYKRITSGMDPLHLVDKSRGY